VGSARAPPNNIGSFKKLAMHQQSHLKPKMLRNAKLTDLIDLQAKAIKRTPRKGWFSDELTDEAQVVFATLAGLIRLSLTRMVLRS
jgi:hypothetical protein